MRAASAGDAVGLCSVRLRHPRGRPHLRHLLSAGRDGRTSHNLFLRVRRALRAHWALVVDCERHSFAARRDKIRYRERERQDVLCY